MSVGAVFMGSMTYIGNGPNFMVKAIAEESGVRMPSFFGYMFKYSIPLLVPVFVIVTLAFLQGVTELPTVVDDVSRAADSAISAQIEPPPVGEPAGGLGFGFGLVRCSRSPPWHFAGFAWRSTLPTA